MPRDAVSRIANVERNGGQKLVNLAGTTPAIYDLEFCLVIHVTTIFSESLLVDFLFEIYIYMMWTIVIS